MSKSQAEGRAMGGWQTEMPLVGPAGEHIDLWRTLTSHGLTELPPLALDPERRVMRVTLPAGGGRPRIVEVSAGRPGYLRLGVQGRTPGKTAQADLERTARHMLRLDEDLSDFYSRVAEDPELAWVTRGAGRLVRTPTVFEDVIKTICTTNCAWSATERMIRALCEHLGEPAQGAPKQGPLGRTFPTPQAMAEVDEAFYRDVARAGYRASYLRSIAQDVASGELDLEGLGLAGPEDLPDDALAEQLLALPGVGPYAAAHVMLVLGRTSRLILDSWTRPKYAKLVGRAKVSDKTIQRRFKKYGRHSGLAFWLFLTRDWVDD
jgi:3-methyladenine DNA glycosylase/8-oxoguanine DNA glycosylase